LSLTGDKREHIARIDDHLAQLTDVEIDRLVQTGDVLSDNSLGMGTKHPFGQFYAPFDWINEDADIVLIGITPGKRQAKAALKALRSALVGGKSVDEAAKMAKQAASFEGEMRDIAARLMNRFDLHKIFGLSDTKELFGGASQRAHYTSLLRYPVLHWQTKKKPDGKKSTGWFDYSGGDDAFSAEMLLRSIRENFEPELAKFRQAWLVPFGPIPARALEGMVQRGLVDSDRVLPGINHPSGTQRNRHNCQLNISADHSMCARNVGCETIRGRSSRLEKIVATRLAGITG